MSRCFKVCWTQEPILFLFKGFIFPPSVVPLWLCCLGRQRYSTTPNPSYIPDCNCMPPKGVFLSKIIWKSSVCTETLRQNSGWCIFNDYRNNVLCSHKLEPNKTHSWSTDKLCSQTQHFNIFTSRRYMFRFIRTIVMHLY